MRGARFLTEIAEALRESKKYGEPGEEHIRIDVKTARMVAVELDRIVSEEKRQSQV